MSGKKQSWKVSSVTRISKPFLWECLVQLSSTDELIWPMWQHCDVWPKSPLKEGLAPHLLGVLSTGRQPAAVSPLWELPQPHRTTSPKHTPSWGCPYSGTSQCKAQNCSFAHLRTTLKAIPTPELRGVGRGGCWSCIADQPVSLPDQVWGPRALLNKHLQVKLYLRVWILENPVWIAPFPNSVGLPNPFFTDYLKSIRFKKHVFGCRRKNWVSTCVGSGGEPPKSSPPPYGFL